MTESPPEDCRPQVPCAKPRSGLHPREHAPWVSPFVISLCHPAGKHVLRTEGGGEARLPEVSNFDCLPGKAGGSPKGLGHLPIAYSPRLATVRVPLLLTLAVCEPPQPTHPKPNDLLRKRSHHNGDACPSAIPCLNSVRELEEVRYRIRAYEFRLPLCVTL